MSPRKPSKPKPKRTRATVEPGSMATAYLRPGQYDVELTPDRGGWACVYGKSGVPVWGCNATFARVCLLGEELP